MAFKPIKRSTRTLLYRLHATISREKNVKDIQQPFKTWRSKPSQTCCKQLLLLSRGAAGICWPSLPTFVPFPSPARPLIRARAEVERCRDTLSRVVVVVLGFQALASLNPRTKRISLNSKNIAKITRSLQLLQALKPSTLLTAEAVVRFSGGSQDEVVVSLSALELPKQPSLAVSFFGFSFSNHLWM